MSMLDIEKRLNRQNVIKESTNSVVAENDTWKVYKATDEASMKKYGRDAQWAMSQAWNTYVEHGLEAVYVFTKKGEIDRRGKTDKYAVCVYSDGKQEIFDQQDGKVKTIPNSAGINISGVKLSSTVKESVKITKSELKEMIREAIREELKTRKTLKESSEDFANVTLGKTLIDFNVVKNVAQLEEIFDEYYMDPDNYLSYNEYITQFVPSLLDNPTVPSWAKKLFDSSTDVNSIAMAGGDETDDVVAACYQAIEDCGYDPDDYSMDDIGEFIAGRAVYGFFIENGTLYVYISCPEVDLDVNFVQDHLGLEFK